MRDLSRHTPVNVDGEQLAVPVGIHAHRIRGGQEDRTFPVAGQEAGPRVHAPIVRELDELLLAVLDEDIGDRKNRRGDIGGPVGVPGRLTRRSSIAAPRDTECGNELCTGAERRLGRAVRCRPSIPIVKKLRVFRSAGRAPSGSAYVWNTIVSLATNLGQQVRNNGELKGLSSSRTCRGWRLAGVSGFQPSSTVGRSASTAAIPLPAPR